MPPVQEYLFQSIREKLGPGDSLVDVVAGVLFVSNDSAYRRIRGETPLVLEEAKQLCDHFSLSLDELLRTRPETISFTSIEVDTREQSFTNYLQGMLSTMQQIAQAGNSEIIYLTKDMPVFINFLYRPLFAFRYFFWMKSNIQHPDFVNASFSIDLLSKEDEQLGMEINRVYNSIPSTEIWNTEAVNSLISQVEYYREAGYFSSEKDIDLIYDSLRKLIEHFRERAEQGCKFLPGENMHVKKENFMFFYNRVLLADNTIMAIIHGKKILYLSYEVLNYMYTMDEKFCNGVYEKLQTTMRKSTLLSKASEKQRNIFFNLLLKKIPARSTFSNTNHI
ncbi:MAG TPA: hypothetical protein VGC29_06380 [Flavisolibacter sp.]